MILLASTGTPALAGLGAAGALRHRLRDAARPSTSPPRRRSSASSPRPRRAARSPTTSPTAASPSRSPRLRCTRASAPGSTFRSTRSTLFGEGCGQVILALPADQVETDPLGSDVGVRRIGEVGGDEILGVPLARPAGRLGA